jgi:predicted RNA-binding protein with PIN domain
LLEYLAEYRRTRPQHRLTVVFDGWQGGGFQESRDRRPGILIIYSRLGERADEVIKRLLVRERERAVVVSSDRELQEFAHRVGAAWIAAAQFEADHLRQASGDYQFLKNFRPAI